MIIDLNMFRKETIEKALTICNAEDGDLMLSLLVNAFGGDTAYANLCLAMVAIYYNYGVDDGIDAFVKLLGSNKEEKEET